ncbi:MAG: substrate-binding domain-containing protein, partial [Microbacterium sp.]
VPDTTPESIERAVTQLRREQVDGIIVLAPQVRVFNAVHAMPVDIPFVSLQAASGGLEDRIAPDQVAGARSAVEHLIELGHVDILHLSGPQDWIEADSRMHGYLSALRDADLPTIPPIRGDWTADFGHFAGVELARRGGFTAAFVGNDTMAIGFMHGLRSHGLRVPEDISVIGFDDIPVSAHVFPSLSTIHVDFAELGRRAVELLVAELTGAAQPPLELLHPRLVVRESTAPPSRTA